MLKRAILVVFALMPAAALPAPAFAAPEWSVRLFSDPAGANVRLGPIAQDGAAAGAKFLPDGTPRAVYFNGRSLKDLSSRLGRELDHRPE